MRDPHIIVKRPLVTEKGSFLSERSNMYSFEVVGDANKVEIRKAIESLFKVNVVGVNTTVRKGKVKGLGWRTYARPNIKRALVKLKPGQSIDFV